MRLAGAAINIFMATIGGAHYLQDDGWWYLLLGLLNAGVAGVYLEGYFDATRSA